MIREIIDKNEWEGFLEKCGEKNFTCSWNWGEFQKTFRYGIRRLGFYDNSQLRAAALAITIKARRGSFLFVPYGPDILPGIAEQKSEILKEFLSELKNIAKSEKLLFIRIQPIWKNNGENRQIFKNLGFRDAPAFVHAEMTWRLDLSRPEEELLGAMRKTTRYLIRQARKNPDVDILKNPPDGGSRLEPFDYVEVYNRLYQATVDRHNFTPFGFDYLKNEFRVFGSDNQAAVILGRYKKEVVAGGIFIYWQGEGYYHQGASNQKFSKIPVSYLVLWEAIQEAKRRGCQVFNFWGGVDPDQKPSHPWAGLSRFKAGFGGTKYEYAPTQDYVISPLYWITYLFERLRRWRRGL